MTVLKQGHDCREVYMYVRRSENTYFLLPAIAIGVDSEDRIFLEVAWLSWAVGIG